MDDEISYFIKDLYVSLYIDLCDEDKQYLGLTLTEILHEDPSSLIKKIGILHDRLVEVKSSIKQVEFYKQFSENEGYQKALQKLDSEIRNHIKHELQMRVFLETLQNKIANFAKKIENQSETKTSRLKHEKSKLKVSINLKSSELEEIKKSINSSEEIELLQLKEKAAKDSEKILELEKENARMKSRYSQVKLELEFMNNEYERQKHEFLNLKNLMINAEYRRPNNSIEKRGEIKEGEEKVLRASKTPKRNDSSPFRACQTGSKRPSKVPQGTVKLEKSPVIRGDKKGLTKVKNKLQAYLTSKK